MSSRCVVEYARETKAVDSMNTPIRKAVKTQAFVLVVRKIAMRAMATNAMAPRQATAMDGR